MVKVLLVGDVEPQASAVHNALMDTGGIRLVRGYEYLPDLVIVAGWRRILPPPLLSLPRLGTVGFHSAKLPEYPGRAPVPWALLRGDDFTENTMLFLDEGIDTGDIIDARRIALYPFDTPERVYQRMAITAVEMLRQHLPALLEGTAPRTPQDLSRRGPLTTKDGWDRWFERERMAAGHA